MRFTFAFLLLLLLIFVSPAIAQINFDGDDVITLGNVAALDFDNTESFTVAAWVRTTSTDNMCVISKKSGGGSSNTGWACRVISGLWRGELGNGTTQEATSSVGAVNNGAWRHVAMVIDATGNGTMRLYIDGSLDGEDTDTLDVSAANSVAVNVGVYDNGSLDFIGDIDDVTIWSRPLSASEIAILKNSGRRRIPPLRSNLVLFLPLDDQSIAAGSYPTTSNFVRDRSGSGLHGTVAKGAGGATRVTRN